jgi:hypothetical protein
MQAMETIQSRTECHVDFPASSMGHVQEIAAGQTNGMTLLAVVSQACCAPSLEACQSVWKEGPRIAEDK